MYFGLVAYIATLIVLSVIWFFVLGYFSFLMCFCFIALFFISLLISFKAMEKTEVSVQLTSLITQKNDKIELCFQRNSHSLVHCGMIFIQYHIYDSLHNCYYHGKLKMYNEIEIVQMKINYAGAYYIHIDKIYCYDILKCAFFKHQQDLCEDFYVFPQFCPLPLIQEETVSFHNDSLDYSSYHDGNDYSEVFDIRSFRDTDSLKHIHWKVSLKKNELYVKEGSQPIIKKVLLFLQITQDNLRNDKAIENFYSTCLTFLNRQEEFEIICPSSKDGEVSIELIKNDEFFKVCFMRILKYPVIDLEEVCHSLKDYLDIYVVTSRGIEVYHHE